MQCNRFYRRVRVNRSVPQVSHSIAEIVDYPTAADGTALATVITEYGDVIDIPTAHIFATAGRTYGRTA